VKSSALIIVKPRSDWGEATMEDVLKCIFPRKPEELSVVAGMILNEVADHGEMPVSEWRTFLKKHPGVSQASYYSALRQLVGVGVLGKERGMYYLSDKFSDTLRRMAAIWDSRMGKLMSGGQRFEEALVDKKEIDGAGKIPTGRHPADRTAHPTLKAQGPAKNRPGQGARARRNSRARLWAGFPLWPSWPTRPVWVGRD